MLSDVAFEGRELLVTNTQSDNVVNMLSDTVFEGREHCCHGSSSCKCRTALSDIVFEGRKRCRTLLWLTSAGRSSVRRPAAGSPRARGPSAHYCRESFGRHPPPAAAYRPQQTLCFGAQGDRIIGQRWADLTASGRAAPAATMSAVLPSGSAASTSALCPQQTSRSLSLGNIAFETERKFRG